MNKKISILLMITIIAILCSPIIYATDIVMDLNTTTTNTVSPTTTNTTTSDSFVDNTTIYPDQTADTSTIEEPITSTVASEDYDESSELSISNIINIILIVVGIVLILLGIAVILRLK